MYVCMHAHVCVGVCMRYLLNTEFSFRYKSHKHAYKVRSITKYYLWSYTSANVPCYRCVSTLVYASLWMPWYLLDCQHNADYLPLPLLLPCNIKTYNCECGVCVYGKLLCVCMCVCVCMHVCVWVCAYMHVCACAYMCGLKRLREDECLYVCKTIVQHTHTHTHIHTHTQTTTSLLKGFWK